MPDSDTQLALRRLARDDDTKIDLAEAALLLANREHPGIALADYREHLAELVTAVETAYGELPDRLAAKRQALASVIHDSFDYAGDRESYDDLQNANLMRVIDRRKGLPIALGILHIHCGRKLGWDICGLNFPGHFLIRLEDDADRMILDPFNNGVEVTVAGLRDLLKATHGTEAELSPAHYAIAGNRDILIRLQNNRKIRLLKADQIAPCLTVIEDMLLFAPGDAALWHEAGVLNAHLENLRAALIAFEHCLDLSDNPADRARVTRHIADLRARLN
jgi:regulator of sirC expression with transglutaminase-like and TPR domain